MEVIVSIPIIINKQRRERDETGQQTKRKQEDFLYVHTISLQLIHEDRTGEE